MTSTSATGAVWSSLTTTFRPFGSVKYSTGTLNPWARPWMAVATIMRATSSTWCGLGILVTVRGRYGPIWNCRRTNAFTGFLPSSRRIAGSQDARDPGQRRLGLGRGPQVAVEEHVAA